MKGQYDYTQKVPRGHYRHRYVGGVPMPDSTRQAIYLAQNRGRPLTVAQERQLRKTGIRADLAASRLLP